jgi:tetrahydromethanopterin S-methyltransferase subunit C
MRTCALQFVGCCRSCFVTRMGSVCAGLDTHLIGHIGAEAHEVVAGAGEDVGVPSTVQHNDGMLACRIAVLIPIRNVCSVREL